MRSRHTVDKRAKIRKHAIGLTQSPLQAGFQTPPAGCHTSIIMEKCVSPNAINSNIVETHKKPVFDNGKNGAETQYLKIWQLQFN